MTTNDTQPDVIPTQPIPKQVEWLQTQFHQEIVKQSERMDDLAKQFFTLFIGIAGLYATVLKLAAGQSSPFQQEAYVCVPYGLWAIALLCVMLALFPKRYSVNPNIIHRGASSPGSELSIEEFYRFSAAYKYKWLVMAASCFFAGLVAAVWLISV